MTGRRRAPAVAVLCAGLALVTAGCVEMPTDGAVHEADTSADTSVEQASAIDAVPPEAKAQPADIVDGFMDAMTGWPIQHGIARQFLTEEAAAAWEPDQGMITFDDSLPPDLDGNTATIELSGAERIDASGAWRGEVDKDLRFEMTLEDGEYRITNPLDALVVDSSWFAQRYRQMSLYFFDPTGQILVPEPVFVPRGEQLASTLIARLADGPGADLNGVSRSYLPADLDPGLSVPVTDQGVAQVEFGESVAAPQGGEDLERMLAQLAWTLGQVPGISALRVSIGGEPLQLAGGGTEYDVDEAQAYDPAGADANPLLYGLRDGRLVYGEPASLAPAAGPFGARDYGLRSISLRLDAGVAAGVTADSLWIAEVRDAASDEARLAADGLTNPLPPAWDHSGRLWVVDRPTGRARVAYRKSGRLVALDVPGVSGRRVQAFLVSRDGTRFVAVVRGPERDEIRAGRILVDDQGRIARAGRTRQIPIERVDRARIADIAWSSPTSIVLLRPVSPETELFEVRTVAVDGAPTVAEPLTTSVNGVIGLAAAPASPPYAVTLDGLINLESLRSVEFSEGRVTSLKYVG